MKLKLKLSVQVMCPATAEVEVEWPAHRDGVAATVADLEKNLPDVLDKLEDTYRENYKDYLAGHRIGLAPRNPVDWNVDPSDINPDYSEVEVDEFEEVKS